MFTLIKKDFHLFQWYIYLIIAFFIFVFYILLINPSFTMLISFFFFFFTVFSYDEKNNAHRYLASMPVPKSLLIKSRYYFSIIVLLAILFFQWGLMILLDNVLSTTHYVYDLRDIMTMFSYGCVWIVIGIPIISFFRSLYMATGVIITVFGIVSYLMINPLVHILHMENEIIFNELDAGYVLLIEKYIPYQPYISLLMITVLLLYLSQKLSIYFFTKKDL